jgi:hypothetical protein
MNRSKKKGEPWFIEFDLRTREEHVGMVPGVIKRWSGDVRKVFPFLKGSRVELWGWALVILGEGENPEQSHKVLLERLRKRDPRVDLSTKWGRCIDQWIEEFVDSAPPLTANSSTSSTQHRDRPETPINTGS